MYANILSLRHTLEMFDFGFSWLVYVDNNYVASLLSFETSDRLGMLVFLVKRIGHNFGCFNIQEKIQATT